MTLGCLRPPPSLSSSSAVSLALALPAPLRPRRACLVRPLSPRRRSTRRLPLPSYHSPSAVTLARSLARSLRLAVLLVSLHTIRTYTPRREAKQARTRTQEFADTMQRRWI